MDNEAMNHGQTTKSSEDATSRFLAMQRSIAGSDLLKHLQLGNLGSEGVSSSMHANNFEPANNFSSLGLAGLAAAAGLTGLPLSSGGLSPMNSSVPTIAALLAASQEKMVSEFRHNLNGLEKEHGVQDMQQAKDYFEMNEEAVNRLNELKDIKRNMMNYSNSNEKETGKDEVPSSDNTNSVISTSPLNSRSLPSPRESQIIPTNLPNRK